MLHLQEVQTWVQVVSALAVVFFSRKNSIKYSFLHCHSFISIDKTEVLCPPASIQALLNNTKCMDSIDLPF